MAMPTRINWHVTSKSNLLMLEPWPAELLRRFDLIVFDWDGTAVPVRHSPLDDLLGPLQSLLDFGTACVIVSGTNVQNLLGQGLAELPAFSKKGLTLCVNRGSEVYRFTPAGEAERIYERQGTSGENAALDEAVGALKRYADSFGLETRVVSQRLNRRKLDLIPVPEWADPPKSKFAELYGAVSERLRGRGIEGGLKQMMDEALRLSRAAGLEDPKITSDFKHVEIGLTDKGDAARWIFENLIGSPRASLGRSVFFGDEFGSVGGVKGSDSFMLLPELKGCPFVSVGVEPAGVPEGVLHPGGGPARFIEFLKSQEELHEKGLRPCGENAWRLEQEGFDPSSEREMESLFAIGNGHCGLRGSSDFPIPASQSDFFISGLYDRKMSSLPYSEVEILVNAPKAGVLSEMVPLPSPLNWEARAGDEKLELISPRMKFHTRLLDFKQGAYFERSDFLFEGGPDVSLNSFRCASLQETRLILQEIEVSSKTGIGGLKLTFRVGAPLQSAIYPHITEVSRLPGSVAYKTGGSGITVEIHSRIYVSGRPSPGSEVILNLSAGSRVLVRRAFVFWTDFDDPATRERLKETMERFSWREFEERFHEHSEAWNDFWRAAGIEYAGNEELNHATRFNFYHMNIAASAGHSMGARGLTGRAYEGHVFWDTETFVFPFFVHSQPEKAKRLLQYRHVTLDGARARARELGYKGACYAWESAANGDDVTPDAIRIKGLNGDIPIFTGREQIHVTADVAHAVWRYWDATHDENFMAGPGAEILFETARFWSSRATLGSEAYHIEKVVGPDEYHHGVDDNAYTNWMARFNLERAVWTFEWLASKGEIRRFGVTPDEAALWRDVAERLYQPGPNSAGVIEQFRGFFDLKPASFKEGEKWRAPLERLLRWDEVNRYQVIKQADVLMIPFLFPGAWTADQMRANYEYYEPITDHGSSLSPAVYGAIAARIGKTGDAAAYWGQSLRFDLLDRMKNTSLGIHLGCMGGTWQALVFHILGLKFTADDPVFEGLGSGLPPEAREVNIPFFYQGRTFHLLYRLNRGEHHDV